MKNRLFLFLLVIPAVFLLTACGIFEKTYIVETDYPLAARTETAPGDTLSVTNYNTLREGIRRTVSDGLDSRTILFDSAYSGNPAEDLAAACWQVRTEDALCIYCVENISYELTQIVSVTEAKLSITYSPNAISVSEIIRMPYATELDSHIADAISSGNIQRAIMISRSNLSADNMADRFAAVYRKNPGLSPVEPDVEVSLFSGTGTQRLYEFTLHTGLSQQEFFRRKEELDSLVYPIEDDADERTRAETAALELADACDDNAPGTVYAALIDKSASPEGIALAYVELCRRSGIDCQIVYGQKDWKDHCWNIVCIDGDYYHVDLFAGMKAGFMKTDSAFWGSYRWPVNDYPKCNGSDDL